MTIRNECADGSVFRMQFNAPVDMGAVEDVLLLAILAVCCLHGEAAVRLETSYALDADSRLVVLDASLPLALSVARVFVGMCSHELGDDAFQVRRSKGSVIAEVTRAS